MRNISIVAGTVFFVIVVTFGAAAQEGREEKPFTPTEFNKFMDDWPAFVTWAEARGEHYQNLDAPGAGTRFSNDMASFLGRKGWQPERFFYVLSHVTYGMMALQTQQVPEIASRLKEQMAAIEKDPNIPEPQKQMLLSQMTQSLDQTTKLQLYGKDLPHQEMELIKSNRDKLLAVMEPKKE